MKTIFPDEVGKPERTMDRSLALLTTQPLPTSIIFFGTIGVGKSTAIDNVAPLLDIDTSHVIKESFVTESGIVKDTIEGRLFAAFCKDPVQYAVDFEVALATKREEDMQRLISHGGIAERSLPEDLVFMFANHVIGNCTDDQFRVYRTIHARLTRRTPSPDLMVWLQAPIDICIERIRSRGREGEKWLWETKAGRDYMEALDVGYQYIFNRIGSEKIMKYDCTTVADPAALAIAIQTHLESQSIASMGLPVL